MTVAPSTQPDRAPGVMLIGIDVPIGDLIGLLIKVFFASIPAGILAWGLWYILVTAVLPSL
jgi:hypothetical protein